MAVISQNPIIYFQNLMANVCTKRQILKQANNICSLLQSVFRIISENEPHLLCFGREDALGCGV